MTSLPNANLPPLLQKMQVEIEAGPFRRVVELIQSGAIGAVRVHQVEERRVVQGVAVLIVVVAFLGLGFARTSLDGSAFDLAVLNRSIGDNCLSERAGAIAPALSAYGPVPGPRRL